MIAVAGVFLMVTFDERPIATPQGSTQPIAGAGMPATVWPENAIDQISAADVQAAVDAGDDALSWRTDPKEVVEHFGPAVLGREMLISDTVIEGDAATVDAWPCPPGERPSELSCDAPIGSAMRFGLVQPASQGDGGIWSVASVSSEPLVIRASDGTEQALAEGSEIEFIVSQLPDATRAHVGIVASDGCNVIHTMEHLGDGRAIIRVPPFGETSFRCAAEPAGYAFVYVTDDTTLPSNDPIDEPTAVEYPWLTIVPFPIVSSERSLDADAAVDGQRGTELRGVERELRTVLLEPRVDIADGGAAGRWGADPQGDRELHSPRVPDRSRR